MKKILSLIIPILLLSACQLPTFSKNPDPLPIGLKTFDSCKSLQDFISDHAVVPSYGFVGSPTGFYPIPPQGEAITQDVEDANDDRDENNPTSDLSVEEADIVKRSGNRLYRLTPNSKALIAYDVTEASHPERLGAFFFPSLPIEIYAYGHEVVSIRYDDRYFSQVIVEIIDWSDPATPVLKDRKKVDGFYSNSRQVGSSLYVGVQETQTRDGLKTLDSCADIHVSTPLEMNSAQSLNLFSLIHFDLDPTSATSLVQPEKIMLLGSYDSTIYATPEHFYLTHYSYETDRTSFYLVGLSGSMTVLAWSEVPGRLVNQFALDEWTRQWSQDQNQEDSNHKEKKFFRLATTTSQWLTHSDTVKNYLSVFDVSDDSLTKRTDPLLQPIGQIDSITPGESITAARFLENRAFLTTFVFTDPLVVIDLSDPTSPQVKGELEVPGYAYFLYPWSHFILSISQDWDLDSWGDAWIASNDESINGSVTLNLFDVSDLSSPHLVDREKIPQSWSSDVFYDHRAFSFFEDQNIFALPTLTQTGSIMALYSLDELEGIRFLGSVNHGHDKTPPSVEDEFFNEDDGAPKRSLEIDGWLYTISNRGLQVHGFEDLVEDVFQDTASLNTQSALQ